MSIIHYSPSTKPGSPEVWGIYEADTGSVQYVCADPITRRAALIDIVLNFDPTAVHISSSSADEVLALVRHNNLRIDWILDTHPHADHISASNYLKHMLNAPNAIGEKVLDIGELWGDYYNTPKSFEADCNFDYLFADGETFQIGELDAEVMLSPGHTLGSITYVVGDAAFVHDTLMYPDSGTSRADFPGGSSDDLWNSLQAILALPDDTRLFVGHDYCGGGRSEPLWETTVAMQKASNIHLDRGKTKADFVRLRDARDAKLPLPDRMLSVMQINLRGGRLPKAENNGRRYLKLPINLFDTDGVNSRPAKQGVR